MAADWKGGQYQRYLLNISALYKQRPDLKAYLELLLSIGAIAMFIVFAIKPTLITIADLLTKINSEQQTSTALDTKLKNLGTALTIFTEQKPNIDVLNTSVPTGPDVASYIRQIEGVVKKNSGSVTTISVDQVNLIAPSTIASASADTSSPKTINISLSVSGTYQNLFGLLQDLENLRRPETLNKLDFNIVQTSDNSKTLNLTLSSQSPYN